MNNLVKKMIAEAIGTFVLVFVSCGVAAFTGGSLVATSLAFGLSIVAMAYSIGRISGCHINPAVSLGVFLAHKMTAKEFGLYVLSQVVGGILGGIAIFGIASMSGVSLVGDACNYFVGYNAMTNTELTFGNVFGTLLTEVILTFIFVYVILNVTDEKAGTSKIAGLVIGLTLTLVHLIGINLTGTSVNPARSIATAVASAIFNGSFAALAQVWMFIVFPLAGGAIAAFVYMALHNTKEEKTESENKPQE